MLLTYRCSPPWQLNLQANVFSLACRMLGILFLLCFQLEGVINISKLRNFTHPGKSKIFPLCSQHWPVIAVWGRTAPGAWLHVPLITTVSVCSLATSSLSWPWTLKSCKLSTLVPQPASWSWSIKERKRKREKRKEKGKKQTTTKKKKYLDDYPQAALYICIYSRGIKNLRVPFTPTKK